MVKINGINELIAVPYGPEIFIGMPEYVDDVATAGDKEDVEKGIRNCRGMQKYKFSYGLEKTKYMVVHSGSEKAEVITEKVKQGVVEETEKYQYVGLFVNNKGNLSTHLEFLRGKIRDSMKVLLNTGHESKVGKEALRVKLTLYSSTIVPAVLNNLETWE